MIVDTTLTIDFLRRRAEAIAFLDDLRSNGELATHPVVVAETDCLIAATASRLGMPVATLNDRDFSCFGDVRVVRPY